MAETSNLLTQLKQRFSVKTIEPFGQCIAVSKENYRKEWTPILQDIGCTVMSQSFNGEVFYFVKEPSEPTPKPQLEHQTELKPQNSRRFWTNQHDSMLKELYSQRLSTREISLKLGFSRQTIKNHVEQLGLESELQQPKSSDPELQPQLQTQHNSLNDNAVKEFLSAASMLYPSHKAACAKLLQECSAKILAEVKQ